MYFIERHDPHLASVQSYYFHKYNMQKEDVEWTLDKNRAVCYHNKGSAQREAQSITVYLNDKWNMTGTRCRVVEVDFNLDPIENKKQKKDPIKAYDEAMKGI